MPAETNRLEPYLRTNCPKGLAWQPLAWIGEPLILLAPRFTAGLGILVWAGNKRKTMMALRLHTQPTHEPPFSVFCAGLGGTNFTNDGWGTQTPWSEEVRAQFLPALVAACTTLHVRTLLLRDGRRFETAFGQLPNISIASTLEEAASFMGLTHARTCDGLRSLFAEDSMLTEFHKLSD